MSRGGRAGHRVRRRVGGLLLAVVAVVTAAAAGGVALAAPAAAHAQVVAVEPAAGSTVAAPPEQVVVRFSEPVRAPVTVVLVAGDGRPAASGPAVLEGTVLRQPVRPDAAPGAWDLAVRVVGDDGHPVVGTARFAVGAGAATGAADDGPRRPAAAVAVGLFLLVAGAGVALRARRSVGVPAARPAAGPVTGACLVGVCLAGAGALVLALALGGGAPQPVSPGLPDAGPLVGWARPVLRLAVDGALVVAFGLLLGAAWLVRSSSRGGPDDAPPGRVPAADVALAGWTAALGAVAVALQVWVTASDISGSGLAAGTGPAGLATFVVQDPQGRALGVQLALVVAVAVLATGVAGGRAGVPRRLAAVLAALAAAALLPPLVVGHSAGTGGPGLVPTVLAVHVLAAATWVGGLAALVRAAVVVGADGMRASLPAWSRLALGCAVAVGLTGLVNLGLRLDGPGGLLTGYGALAGLKVAAFAGLVVVGVAQRRRVAAVVADGAATRATAVRAVVRLAVAEIVLMAATFGTAAALTRTPSPPRAPDLSEDATVGVARAVLGYTPPPEATPLRLLTGVLVDGPALLLLAALAAWLVRHVRRHRPAGPQVAAAALGTAVLAWATVGGLGLYARVGLPAHVGAHLLVTVVVPLLLLRGGLEDALRARGVRRLPAPAAAALLVVVAAGPYLPGVLDGVMAAPGGAWLLPAAGLAGGVLALRGAPVVVLAAGAVACGALSWWLVGTATLVGLDWFSGFSVPYLRNFADDQRRAGFVAWFCGGLPLLLLLAGRVVRPVAQAPSVGAPQRGDDAASMPYHAASSTPAESPRPNV